MRRLSIIAASFSLALLSTSTLSFAADQYTYRAGQPYLKAAAGSHTDCEAQCRGDAACRGWNFVRPNPRSRSGICEFNARKAVPVSSPVSISGEINTSVDPLMSHAVPQISRLTGNTVRVGTPIMPNREIPKRRIAKRQMAVAPMQGGKNGQNGQKRIVRRMPIPVAAQRPAQANYKRTMPALNLASKANVRTPRIYGSLATPTAKLQIPQQTARSQRTPAPQMPQVQQRPQINQPQPRQQQMYRQQMLAAQRAMAAPRGPQQFAPQPPQQRQMRPQAGPQTRAQARPQMMPQQNPYAQNPYAQNPAAPNPYAQRQIQQSGSLYGSLHDDLTQNMTAVPRPQTAPDQVRNPDAPLATSRAVPTKPVEAEALETRAKGYPAIAGLAGG